MSSAVRAPGSSLSSRWLWAVGAAALILCFAQSPGLVSPDTKLDLTANPLRFLARATNLWNSELPFGQAQNQAYGYLFPHGAFFLLGDTLGLPGWVTQRLWWARLLTTIGAISSETLPMMLAPWVLLPVILALRGSGSLRVLAARSALALALMG